MGETTNGIRIVAAIGSVRPGNQTAKALALAVDEMRKHDGIEVEVIDPAEVAMSLPGTAKDPAVMQSLLPPGQSLPPSLNTLPRSLNIAAMEREPH